MDYIMDYIIDYIMDYSFMDYKHDRIQNYGSNR